MPKEWVNLKPTSSQVHLGRGERKWRSGEKEKEEEEGGEEGKCVCPAARAGGSVAV